MYVVNLLGGPGVGKSTAASGLYSLLKMHGLSCELATEYAKDLVWEKRHVALKNQSYVFGKQYHKLWRLKDQVDVIITDSPIILGLLYTAEGQETEYFGKHVVTTFNKFNNLNYLLTRTRSDEYDENGREQTLEEAKAIDAANLKLLEDNNLKYNKVPGSMYGTNYMLYDILDLFNIELVCQFKSI